MGTCSVESCSRPSRKRGMCDLHYQRWQRYGTTDLPTSEDRFWARVDRTAGPNGCWLWLGPKLPRGYGLLSVNYRRLYAHRYAYELTVGPIPDGMHIDHFVCDNPPCVNPAHLRPVTVRENVLRSKSIAAKHLARTHCGQGHPYDEANTHVKADGSRSCRACDRIRAAEKRGPRPPPITHCKHGHEFNEANTSWRGNSRVCRACMREAQRRYQQRKRGG